MCLNVYTYTQAYGITKQRSYVVVKVGDEEKKTTVGIGEQWRQRCVASAAGMPLCWHVQHITAVVNTG